MTLTRGTRARSISLWFSAVWVCGFGKGLEGYLLARQGLVRDVTVLLYPCTCLCPKRAPLHVDEADDGALRGEGGLLEQGAEESVDVLEGWEEQGRADLLHAVYGCGC